jgi:hypothetical protein
MLIGCFGGISAGIVSVVMFTPDQVVTHFFGS